MTFECINLKLKKFFRTSHWLITSIIYNRLRKLQKMICVIVLCIVKETRVTIMCIHQLQGPKFDIIYYVQIDRCFFLKQKKKKKKRQIDARNIITLIHMMLYIQTTFPSKNKNNSNNSSSFISQKLLNGFVTTKFPILKVYLKKNLFTIYSTIKLQK